MVCSVPFARRFIIDPKDLGRSVYGYGVARGELFGVARDAGNLLNGVQFLTVVGIHDPDCVRLEFG